jgi:hypothetical protein
MHTASSPADSITPDGPSAPPSAVAESVADPVAEPTAPEVAEPPSSRAAEPVEPVVAGDHAPRFSRALLALTAAATIAASPLAVDAFGPADSGQSAHSIPVYLISRISHDVGHNDWAFQGQDAGRVDWVVSYVALGLFWLVVALWMRAYGRKAAVLEAASGAQDGSKRKRRRLWLRVLVAAWSVEAAAGFLTLGAGIYAQWTSTPLGPAVLRVGDLCSPWWSCVAAVLVVARAERSTIALRAILGYAALLTLVLLVPLPGPDVVKVLLITVPAAAPAMLVERPATLTRGAVAAD